MNKDDFDEIKRQLAFSKMDEFFTEHPCDYDSMKTMLMNNPELNFAGVSDDMWLWAGPGYIVKLREEYCDIDGDDGCNGEKLLGCYEHFVSTCKKTIDSYPQED